MHPATGISRNIGLFSQFEPVGDGDSDAEILDREPSGWKAQKKTGSVMTPSPRCGWAEMFQQALLPLAFKDYNASGPPKVARNMDKIYL